MTIGGSDHQAEAGAALTALRDHLRELQLPQIACGRRAIIIFEGPAGAGKKTALRHLASQYPYDEYDGAGMSLRGNADEVAEALGLELANRLRHAGVEVLEARLSHLAYSPEIAGAMLQRQQASAIIAARAQIVQGAVGMVQMALKELSEQDIVQLDEERKAQMVSNLLVVLTSERGTQPVVNAGSLY